MILGNNSVGSYKRNLSKWKYLTERQKWDHHHKFIINETEHQPSRYFCRRKTSLLLTHKVTTANQDPNHTGNSFWQWRWWGRALTSPWAEANNGGLQRLKESCTTHLWNHWFMGHEMRQGEGNISSYRDSILFLSFWLGYCCQDNFIFKWQLLQLTKVRRALKKSS